MGLTDEVIRQNFNGSGKPTQTALFGIQYQDTQNLILYRQNQAPYGKWWVNIKSNYSPALNAVRASSADQSPGFLSDKIDGITIVLDVDTQKLKAVVTAPTYKSNQIPSPLPDGINKIFTVPDTFVAGTLEVFYRGVMYQPGIEFTEAVLLNGFTTTNVPDNSADGGWLICRYKVQLLP